MYTWELSFMKKVNTIRDEELGRLRTNAILNALSTSICNHGAYMVR